MKKPVIGILGAHMSNNGGRLRYLLTTLIMLIVPAWKMLVASPFSFRF